MPKRKIGKPSKIIATEFIYMLLMVIGTCCVIQYSFFSQPYALQSVQHIFIYV